MIEHMYFTRFIIIYLMFYGTVFGIRSKMPKKGEENCFNEIKRLFSSKEYKKAETELESFIQKYPDNSEAKSLLLRTQQMLVNSNQNDRLNTRLDLFQQLNHSWKEPGYQKTIEPVPEKKKRPSLSRKLKKIIIPSLQFSNIGIAEAIGMLSDLAENYNSDKNHPINVIVMDPKNINPNINLSLKNVSLYTILHYIAQSANFQIDIEKDVVVLKSAKDVQPMLITKIFPISRATVIHLIGENVDLQNNEQKQNLFESQKVEEKEAKKDAKDSKTKDSNSKDSKTNTQTKKEVELKDDLFSDKKQPPKNTLGSEEFALKRFFEKSGIDFSIPNSGLAFNGTQLIVSHTHKNIERVKNILAKLNDIKQVQIEAKFLEVQQGALEEIGFKWNMGSRNHVNIATGDDTRSNLRPMSSLSLKEASSSASESNGSTIIPIKDDLPSFPNVLNTGFQTIPLANMAGVISGYQMNFIIQALEQQTGADLMSAPRVTVLSGKKAEIVVAQELRYPKSYSKATSDVGTAGRNTTSSAGATMSSANPENFVVRNIGVQMEVTPIVQKNDLICLKLEPCVTEFEGFVEYGAANVIMNANRTSREPSGCIQPIFSTRRINTEVIVQNGATVVMGGLSREEVKEIHDRVPILSQIPLFGKLFQSKGDASQKRTLLIFVTASLLSTQGQVIHRN